MRLLLVSLCFLSFIGLGQRNLRDSSIVTPIVGMNYKFQMTSGDLNDLWGFNHEIGLSFDYKFKRNFSLGFTSGFIFGNQLNNPEIFTGLYNEFGTITSLSGDPAQVLFLMRGMTAHVNAGWVINKLGNNPNSGLWVQLGAGFLMHKIRIESLYHDVPQLEGDNRKGYDRLHMGFSSRQFIGYLFQHDSRFLNFYAGIECVQGFTENQRAYNFDLEGPDPGTKMDFLWGAKVGWLIPIYKRAPKQFYVD